MKLLPDVFLWPRTNPSDFGDDWDYDSYSDNNPNYALGRTDLHETFNTVVSWAKERFINIGGSLQSLTDCLVYYIFCHHLL